MGPVDSPGFPVRGTEETHHAWSTGLKQGPGIMRRQQPRPRRGEGPSLILLGSESRGGMGCPAGTLLCGPRRTLTSLLPPARPSGASPVHLLRLREPATSGGFSSFPSIPPQDLCICCSFFQDHFLQLCRRQACSGAALNHPEPPLLGCQWSESPLDNGQARTLSLSRVGLEGEEGVGCPSGLSWTRGVGLKGRRGAEPGGSRCRVREHGRTPGV